MPDITRLDELLARCQQLRDAGQSVSAEELCRDCPELLPELRRRLGHAAGQDQVTQATLITTSGQMPAEPTVEPAAGAADRKHDLSFLLPPRGPGELGWLGNYRVLQVLGAGGMGIVLLAEDVSLERQVALKVMLPRVAADPTARGRFLREARAAAQVRHDGVVTIYQVGEADGCPFIAMEFLQGASLDRWLSLNPWPSVPFILRVGREAAEGLAAAHARGLVHRDIKPANLWVEAPNGRVKILDFGLARPADRDAHLTGTGVMVGTPAYMAPEQARGRAVDFRTDLFSLGCLLYRLCTGSPPFPGDTTMAVLTALAVDTPPPIRPRNRGVPLALESLILQLLEKNPTRRPPSAQAVADVLRQIESAEATRVGPGAVAVPAEHNPWEELTQTMEPPLAEPIGPAAGAASVVPRSSRLPVLFAAVGLVALAAVVVVLLRQPREGLVRVDSPEPGVPVVFTANDGRQIVVCSVDARLPEGRYRVRLGEGVLGLELAAGEVSVRNGTTACVELRRLSARGTTRPKAGAPALKRGPVDGEWVRQVRALKGEERAQAVFAKLKELNPALKPGAYEVVGDGVDYISFEGAKNLSPLRALPELTRLGCSSSPLSDLTPLQGLRLKDFSATATAVTDLSALRGMPLEHVSLDNTAVTDLTPIAAPTLKRLHVYACRQLTDLAPLTGCPLEYLICHGSGVRDLSVGRGLPLVELHYDHRSGDRVEPLRGHPTLRLVGGMNRLPVEDFWALVDSRKARFESWVTATAALPAPRQLAAVAEKLREHNQDFDGKLQPEIEGGAVVGLMIDTSRVFDLAPLRALSRLRRLHAAATGPGSVHYLDPLATMSGLTDLSVANNPVADLSPLRGLRLTALDVAGTEVSDLGPLRDHPLESLRLNRTRVKNLSALKRKPLRALHFADTLVNDISPVRDTALREISLDYDPLRGDREWLSSVKSLATVNDKPADVFFREADAFEAWVRQTSALKPEEQCRAVVAKFKERNVDGAYDAREVVVEGDAVVGIRVSACPVRDLSPLRALPRLRLLTITEYGYHANKPLDLRPLAALKLRALSLVCARTADLTPLTGMPLESLYLPWSRTDDLSPLKGAPLKSANIGGRIIRDLSPLSGAPLATLFILDTKVANLAPLRNAPLHFLDCRGSPVRDLSPCARLPLTEIWFDYYPTIDAEPLRQIPTLVTINGKAAGEFWKQVDKKE